jgi:hypothetical protein
VKAIKTTFTKEECRIVVTRDGKGQGREKGRN